MIYGFNNIIYFFMSLYISNGMCLIYTSCLVLMPRRSART